MLLVALALLLQVGHSVPLEGCNAAGSQSAVGQTLGVPFPWTHVGNSILQRYQSNQILQQECLTPLNFSDTPFFTDYPHGITLVTPVSGSEKKQVLHFCALGAEEMQKFVEDLKESIAEVTELEQIRIECKGL